MGTDPECLAPFRKWSSCSFGEHQLRRYSLGSRGVSLRTKHIILILARTDDL